jgi:hypothetical protein
MRKINLCPGLFFLYRPSPFSVISVSSCEILRPLLFPPSTPNAARRLSFQQLYKMGQNGTDFGIYRFRPRCTNDLQQSILQPSHFPGRNPGRCVGRLARHLPLASEPNESERNRTILPGVRYFASWRFCCSLRATPRCSAFRVVCVVRGYLSGCSLKTDCF